MSEPIIDTLIALTGPDKDKVIVIHPAFVYFTGSLETGMMLGQLLYWTPRARLPGGWIAKSDTEWSEELFITAYAARKARKCLVDMGIVESKKAQFSGAPTMHYRINRDSLTTAWVAWIQQNDFANPKERPFKSAKTDSANTQERLGENDTTITEITTETTPEITTSQTTINDETRQWIADLEAQTPTPRGGPRTTEELMEGTRQASEGWRRRLQEQPHLTWGNQSDAAQRALAALDGHADDVRWIGQQMEEVLHLAPDWTTPKAIKRWISETFEALKAAQYDRDTVIAAGQKLRHDRCTVAGPWSITNTARSLAAERKGGGDHGTGSVTNRGDTRWTSEDIARATAEAAAALDA